jgi:hypothetical protein
MPAPQSRFWQPKALDAGCFQPEVSSFGLHLAAEGKAAKTVRTYTEAVQWFAADHLRRETGYVGWEEVRKQDVQEWIIWLLGRYSPAYASNQFRASFDACDRARSAIQPNTRKAIKYKSRRAIL